MSVSSPKERIGTTIADKYKITEVIGEGGMGVVYGGVHDWTGREVAIKVLQLGRGDSDGADEVAQFLKEARVSASIKHRHVVDVLDMGQDRDDGTVYLVLERLEGEPLSDRLKRSPLSLVEAIPIFVPVMDALAAAHEVGIIHRDLKPDNIFLASDKLGKVPKLLDFGIAQVAGEADDKPTGGMVGTPWYMSPEQVRSEHKLTPASDVWSIALVLYEALSGRRAYDIEMVPAALGAIADGPPPPLRDLRPDLPEELYRAIDAALQMDPTARPGMRELIEWLRLASPDVRWPLGMTGEIVLAQSGTGSYSLGDIHALYPPNLSGSHGAAAKKAEPKRSTSTGLIVGVILFALVVATAGIGVGLYFGSGAGGDAGVTVQPVDTPGGVEPGGEEPNGVAPDGVEPGGEEPDGVEPGGEEPNGVEPGEEPDGVDTGEGDPGEGATEENSAGADGAEEGSEGGEGGEDSSGGEGEGSSGSAGAGGEGTSHHHRRHREREPEEGEGNVFELD